MAASLRFMLALIVLASLLAPGGANFLRNKPPAGEHASASLMQASAEEVRQALLKELQGALGDSRRATADRLFELEASLRPMFAALPKNDAGLLEHSVVRYALHRYFAQRHGWLVTGLDPAGDSWNASQATKMLQGRVPTYLQELFEQRLEGRGLGLHDLAALAATLEHLVHDDAVSRLEAAYRALGLPISGGQAEVRVTEALDIFMMMFVLGQDIRTLSETEIEAERASIHRTYPGWKDTQAFVRTVYKNSTGALAGSSVDFEAAKRTVEAVQDQYGPWQNAECQAMKTELLKVEEAGNGRVKLADFYGRTTEGGWQFSESLDYLRQLGALDESSPGRPRVIVANYMSSASNCLANTGFYSVCCLNECEGILSQVESQLAAPTAPVGEVAAAVAGISSATVSAPRSLPAPLLRRLGEIAEGHDGEVPLHGRLFSQWLHHAFPRECPFPHETGTTNPMTPEEWMRQTNGTARVTDDVLREHTVQEDGEAQTEVAAVPWTGAEELVHSTAAPPRRVGRTWKAFFKGLMLLGAFAVVSRSLVSSSLRQASKPKDSLLPLSLKCHSA